MLIISLAFKAYLRKDAVYNFISSMIDIMSKYCSDIMKKHFNEELMMTKENNEVLKALLNVGSLTMIMLIMMLK